jgi:hypothetical protein
MFSANAGRAGHNPAPNRAPHQFDTKLSMLSEELKLPPMPMSAMQNFIDRFNTVSIQEQAMMTGHEKTADRFQDVFPVEKFDATSLVDWRGSNFQELRENGDAGQLLMDEKARHVKALGLIREDEARVDHLLGAFIPLKETASRLKASGNTDNDIVQKEKILNDRVEFYTGAKEFYAQRTSEHLEKIDELTQKIDAAGEQGHFDVGSVDTLLEEYPVFEGSGIFDIKNYPSSPSFFM